MEKVLKLFPKLTKHDVRSTSSGAGGLDVLLSETARGCFPYAVECKNQEKFKGIYDVYEQATGHDHDLEALVVLKMNRKPPLAILSLDAFFELLERINNDKRRT